MVAWAGKSMKVLLRVVLTLLLVVLGLAVGIRLTPKLARVRMPGGAWDTTRNPRRVSVMSRVAQPDWGGGRLSFLARSEAGIVDSVRTASGEDLSRTRAYSRRAGGVVLRRIGTRSELSNNSVMSRPDYALTLAMPSLGQPDRSVLFELPSSDHFREELFPEGLGTRSETLGGFRSCPAPPATDIPLYPRSNCRTQVGRGTACFVGFYLTPDSVEAVRSFYVRVLSRLGWERVAADRPGPLETFAKPGEDRTVVVQLKKQDSVTTRIGLVVMSSGMGTRSELSDNSVMSPRNERK